ncbi:MAG: xanthine dehydrogenase family protein molybdopterin-binding subunit [Nitrososphaerota archaeon]|nr:xanthine dehydrogenase family protein molybdopterin-binding subunit [Nitrososphaerota archaeon]MDG6927245.1 xanthine dehydrogenase family protein molybdopterin-binding subunit [Nitrososphaerota archaeon]MDG6930397.1 xanthine dehydrogenase family protein molybdopterin-binding subunit [Nitrososphaerota archaeon]MDG6932604.1 xanthine dehydrogenase family protein molybdopterin-binding subunit [Nitrososphaerota archaeon]MDG6935658.1 xanthine dehydrogenase family protein molybdopterin-binding subu
MEEELEQKYKSITRSVPRVDSEPKVSGALKFITDMKIENMLFAAVVRSVHAHARILSIDTREAEKISGVKAILTYKDIPGLNAYGAIVPDAPVLAYDRVRYYGEPVALIAADTEELAREAASLVKIEYDPLPVIRSIDESIASSAIALHDNGNIARHTIIKRGDTERAKQEAYLTLDRTYRTPFQKHMFLEPEGGVAYIDESGIINVFAGGQSPYRDKLQIARSLNIPPEKIRTVDYPTGGAFGGKDDVTVQIHLALLAYKTGKPVKLWFSREESGVAGYHRTGSEIHLITSVDKEGGLLSNEAQIYLDTGAYQSFGPTILDVSIETINGPYRIPNYTINANLVYTNNGFSSAFRGFGAPESNFAIESMINELAAELHLDPIDIRLKNILMTGEEGPFGNTVRHSDGLREALMRAKRSKIWAGALQNKKPWQRNGVGIAVAIKGVGFGTLPDYPTAAIEIATEGKVKIMFSNVDYGQGINTGNAQLVAEKLDIPLNQVEVRHADTKYSPDTGSSSASRSTFTSGNALLMACSKALDRLKMEACLYFGTTNEKLEYKEGRFYYKDKSASIYELAKGLKARGETLRFESTFEVPRYPAPIEGTLEVPHVVYMYGTMLSSALLDELTGKVHINQVEFYADIGTVINPSIASGQIEGGIVQGLGFAITEDLKYDASGKPINNNYTTYIVPSVRDVPDIYVEFIDSSEELGPYGAKGVGEISIIPAGASAAHAVYNASGKWVRDLPLLPWKLI